MKIMYLNGAQTGQTMELSPAGATIGRESDNTIQLPMGGVSRYHAKIERDAAGNWLIRDLGSTNGTLVDDVPVIGASPLNPGAVITIGDQLLRCIDSGAAPAANPAPSVQPASSAQPQQSAFFFRPNTTSSIPTATGPVPKQPAPAPAPAPQPVPQPAPQSAEVPHGLFKKKQDKPHPSGSKKFLGNVIFALIVLLAAIVGLWLFLKLNEGPQTSSGQPVAKQKVENPFVLYYEKESVAGTAVFRFVLQIENGQMEVTLDEPQNKRRYYELFKDPVPDELIAKLKQQILDTGFMELQQEKIAGTSQDNRQHRRIMVGFDNKFCDVKVSNDVSETFNRVETIINETLLDEYDLGVISQNVDRILEDARTFLFVAEEAFRSIDTTPSNLPKAISNYKLALRRYQLFDDPKPPEWKTARDGLAKAEAKLEDIRQEGLKNVRLFYELREYDKAIAECNRLLSIFPPDSKTYQGIRESKIKIEKKLSVGNN
ncbi:MAG: FHA domain-containing protein [Lentisphaeria bacterium]|nr:FHA domain-containing protein [Lentisphaeria bacterium]